MSLADYQQVIRDLIRDKDGVLSQGSIDAAITSAVLRYSTDAPRNLLVDETATAYSTQPLPGGWVQDVSVLISVEYPIDRKPASMLDPADFRIRQMSNGLRLELDVTVTEGDIYRIGYTAEHAVDATTDTVPVKHRYAVQCLAAANLCGQLASYFATEGAPLVGADVSDHIGKTERFRARKRDLEAEYVRALGVPEKPVTAAAGVVAQLDNTATQGDDRLFHRKRYPRA